jgi:hypothetical protein
MNEHSMLNHGCSCSQCAAIQSHILGLSFRGTHLPQGNPITTQLVSLKAHFNPTFLAVSPQFLSLNFHRTHAYHGRWIQDWYRAQTAVAAKTQKQKKMISVSESMSSKPIGVMLTKTRALGASISHP